MILQSNLLLTELSIINIESKNSYRPLQGYKEKIFKTRNDPLWSYIVRLIACGTAYSVHLFFRVYSCLFACFR